MHLIVERMGGGGVSILNSPLLLLRLSKCIRTIRLTRAYHTMLTATRWSLRPPMFQRMLVTIGALPFAFLFVHFFACAWMYTATVTKIGAEYSKESWVTNKNLQEADQGYLYLVCM
jgi:hypothetical protein